MPVKLSAKTVANAQPKPQRYEIADSEQPGLRLVVQPSGVKSWAYRYERDGRNTVKVTLGRATGPGAFSLQQARNAANDARRLRSTGKDPADQRRAERAVEAARIAAEEKEARRKDNTVDHVLDRFFADREADLKSLHEVKRLLNKELKTWKRRRIDDILEADASKLIDSIKARGAATTANRTRSNGRAFFNWCIRKKLIDKNPFAEVEPAKAETVRNRMLNDDELRLLWIAISQLDWPWRQFFALTLLTAQRREEVAGMLWAEINLEAADPVWILPPHRTKNGQEHAVPLAPSAVVILGGVDRMQMKETVNGVTKLKDSPFVFTTTGETSISGFSRAKARLDAIMLAIARKEAEKRGDDADTVNLAPWHLHDLRRTAASGMARFGVPVSVAEKVLNHVSGTFAGIVSVYQRHDFLAEKRHALNLWTDHITSLTKARKRNVVQFKAGTR
jgi:integrase